MIFFFFLVPPPIRSIFFFLKLGLQNTVELIFLFFLSSVLHLCAPSSPGCISLGLLFSHALLCGVFSIPFRTLHFRPPHFYLYFCWCFYLYFEMTVIVSFPWCCPFCGIANGRNRISLPFFPVRGYLCVCVSALDFESLSLLLACGRIRVSLFIPSWLCGCFSGLPFFKENIPIREEMLHPPLLVFCAKKSPRRRGWNTRCCVTS